MRPDPVFPFIVGCGRSGTTLLRAMFDAHPDVAVPPESHFLVDVARRRRRYERDGGFDVTRFAADLSRHPRFARWCINRGALHDGVAAASPRGLADAVRATYALYAHREGKTRFVDKTPNYITHLPVIAALLPEAVFVHVVRDGRDVALSLVDVEFGPSTVTRSVALWRRTVEHGRLDGRRLRPTRYRELRYEDFVDAPQRELMALCELFALNYDDSMLRYRERADAIVASTLLPHRHQHVFEPIRRDIREWRTQMAPGDVELCEAIAGDVLADLGYELTTDPRPRARIRAMLARLNALRGWPKVSPRRLGTMGPSGPHPRG